MSIGGQPWRFLIPAIALALSPQPSLAQAAQPGDDIVVQGDRAREAEIVTRMARTVTENPPVDKPVARFGEAVCFGAFGIGRAAGSALVDRMAENAVTAGVRVSGPGCAPNILVGFVGDAAEEIRRVRKKQPGIFVSIPRFEIERALKERGPVKVLTSAETRTDSGEKIDPENPTNKLLTGSRIGFPVQRALVAVVVLIDRRSAIGKTSVQLADYATIRALSSTRMDPARPVAAPPTVLSLFSGDDVPGEMTAFDRAYLRALYSGSADFGAASLASKVAAEYQRPRD